MFPVSVGIAKGIDVGPRVEMAPAHRGPDLSALTALGIKYMERIRRVDQDGICFLSISLRFDAGQAIGFVPAATVPKRDSFLVELPIAVLGSVGMGEEATHCEPLLRFGHILGERLK